MGDILQLIGGSGVSAGVSFLIIKFFLSRHEQKIEELEKQLHEQSIVVATISSEHQEWKMTLKEVVGKINTIDTGIAVLLVKFEGLANNCKNHKGGN